MNLRLLAGNKNFEEFIQAIADQRDADIGQLSDPAHVGNPQLLAYTAGAIARADSILAMYKQALMDSTVE